MEDQNQINIINNPYLTGSDIFNNKTLSVTMEPNNIEEEKKEDNIDNNINPNLDSLKAHLSKVEKDLKVEMKKNELLNEKIEIITNLKENEGKYTENEELRIENNNLKYDIMASNQEINNFKENIKELKLENKELKKKLQNQILYLENIEVNGLKIKINTLSLPEIGSP